MRCWVRALHALLRDTRLFTRVLRPGLVLVAALLVPRWVTAQPVGPSATPKSSATPTDKGAEKRPSKLVEIGLEAALERSRSAYQAGRYDACAKGYGEILAHLDELRAEVAPPTLEQARVYHAACLLAIGDMAAADEQLRSALGDNPLMASPDPVVFPDQVRDLFFKVKADFLDEIQRAQDANLELARQEANKRLEEIRQERLRVERLETAARTETLVHQNYRWIAFVPFGVGQFQNGDDLWGGLLLSSQVLALGAAVAGVSLELAAHTRLPVGRKWRPRTPIASTSRSRPIASSGWLRRRVSCSWQSWACWKPTSTSCRNAPQGHACASCPRTCVRRATCRSRPRST